MIAGSKRVTITRLGMTFDTTERIRDWFDWWIPLFAAAFPDATIRLVQATYSDGPLSAGTHNLDNVFDLEVEGANYGDVMWWLMLHGAWGWWRHLGTWASRDRWHIHFGMLPPGVTYASTKEQVGRALVAIGVKVGEFVDGGWTTSNPHRITTSSQIWDWLDDSLGLKGQHESGIDPAPRPKNLVIFDWPKYRLRKDDPMGAFVKEASELCKEFGFTRVYGARLLLAAAAKQRKGAALAKIQAARGSLYNLDVPKRT